MTEYVAGFLFSPDEKQVLLIRKNRPEWQKGMINGIGGHIEPEETSEEAMSREFLEETGLNILSWYKGAQLYGNGWIVHFFYTCGFLGDAKSMTDEEVRIYEINQLPDSIIPNLRYLIPICLDKNLSKPVMMTERTKEPV